MSNIFIQMNQRARVTRPLLLWALLMAVLMFCFEAGIGSRGAVVSTGVFITLLLGAYLGWQRRSGTTFFAPLISWFFAWPPLLVASMIHEGLIKGLVKGLLLVTFGWTVIGGAEFMVLIMTSSVVQSLRSKSGPSEPDVVVFGPNDNYDS